MGASSKGGYGGPNTRGPGGQGRDYNGNAIGSRMPGQFAIGGAPRPIGGPAPIPGGRPAPGDLYNPEQGPRLGGTFGVDFGSPSDPGYYEARRDAGLGPGDQGVGMGPAVEIDAPVNRFQPQGMIPPAGGRPQPGQMTGPNTRQRYPSGDPRRYANQGGVPGGGPQPGAPTPMPSPPMRGKGGGGGKGGMPGPGGPRMIGGPFNPGGGFQPQIDPMDRFQNGGLPDRADGLDPYS